MGTIKYEVTPKTAKFLDAMIEAEKLYEMANKAMNEDDEFFLDKYFEPFEKNFFAMKEELKKGFMSCVYDELMNKYT